MACFAAGVLAAADFIVVEDGQPREVTSAVPAADPLALSIMVDMSKPVIGKDLPLRDIRAGLGALVKAVYASNPQSKVSLMDFSGAAMTTVSLTSDGDKVLKATGRLVTSQRSSGVLLEGLVDTAKDLAKSGTPRRAIVVLSFDGPEASTIQPRDVAVAVEKTGAAFWAVSIGSNTAPMRDAIFENLPPLTGGKRVTALEASGLEKILGNIGATLASQYVVTYKRPDGAAATTIQAGAKKGASVLRAAWVK